MPTIYLALGSNIGDKKSKLEMAVKYIANLDDTYIISKSSFYITSPVGGPEQADYLNGVLKIQAEFSPVKCLENLKEIEYTIGRKERPRNYPREIDIDILFYDDKIVKREDLTIPHPRLHERGFVLKGLAEISPDLVHPLINRTIRELYEIVKNRNESN